MCCGSRMRSLRKASENARLRRIVADRGRKKPGDDKVAYSELTVYKRISSHSLGGGCVQASRNV